MKTTRPAINHPVPRNLAPGGFSTPQRARSCTMPKGRPPAGAQSTACPANHDPVPRNLAPGRP
jgi:hypothetical protein